MNIDGSSPQRLTTNEGRDLVPMWSRDGKQIAFNSTRDGNWEVYLMNEDGSNQVNLTNNPATGLFRDWSWGGDYILFDSDRDDNWDIY